MKIRNVFMLLLCSLFFCHVQAVPKAKRVLMIGLDGISVAGIQNANTPNLDV